jgi:hypothetical protein
MIVTRNKNSSITVVASQTEAKNLIKILGYCALGLQRNEDLNEGEREDRRELTKMAIELENKLSINSGLA